MKTYIILPKFVLKQNSSEIDVDTFSIADLDCISNNFTVYNDDSVLDLLSAYKNNSVGNLIFLVEKNIEPFLMNYFQKIGFEYAPKIYIKTYNLH